MKKTVPTLLSTVLIAASLGGALMASANEQIAPRGGIPCEVDWMKRGLSDTVGTIGELQSFEREAERGNAGVQLRLGLLRKTRDDKWSAPVDRSYNIRWLERAQAQGSKSAAWELAKIKRRQLTHEAYVRATIAAAEEDGNPWAATILMDATSGRWGSNTKPTSCDKAMVIDGKCAPDDLLPISTASKWAEIAAEGGNAAAQEWLCRAASDGNPERGQPKDDKAAFKWCQIAAHNACVSWSLGRLGNLYRQGDGVEPSREQAERIGKWKRQPWREQDGAFFSQPY